MGAYVCMHVCMYIRIRRHAHAPHIGPGSSLINSRTHSGACWRGWTAEFVPVTGQRLPKIIPSTTRKTQFSFGAKSNDRSNPTYAHGINRFSSTSGRVYGLPLRRNRFAILLLLLLPFFFSFHHVEDRSRGERSSGGRIIIRPR